MKLKFLVTVFVVLLSALSAFGAITEIPSGAQRAITSGAAPEDSRSLAFPINVTSGCLGTVIGSVYQGIAPTSITVTDSLGTSYGTPPIAGELVDNITTFIARGIFSSSGANTVTVNPSGSAGYITFVLDEFCGVDASPNDVDGGGTIGNGTLISDSITTGVAGALILGAASWTGGRTVTPYYTQIAAQEDSVNYVPINAVFYLPGGAAGTFSIAWDLNIIDDWLAQTFSFRPAAAVTGLIRRKAVIVQ